ERGGQPRGVVAVVAVGREAVHLARVDARVLAGRQDRAQRQRELGLRRAAVLVVGGLANPDDRDPAPDTHVPRSVAESHGVALDRPVADAVRGGARRTTMTTTR